MLSHLFFTSEGRINRQEIWTGWLIVVGAAVVGGGVLGLTIGLRLGAMKTGAIIALISAWPIYNLMAKRFQDRNKAGGFALLYTVPSAFTNLATLLGSEGAKGFGLIVLGLVGLWTLVVFLWFFVELNFLPGTPGSNDFGPDPREGGRSGPAFEATTLAAPRTALPGAAPVPLAAASFASAPFASSPSGPRSTFGRR